jgi:hypothetical protein
MRFHAAMGYLPAQFLLARLGFVKSCGPNCRQATTGQTRARSGYPTLTDLC